MGPVAATPPADPNDAAQIEAALGKIIDSQFDPTDFFKGAKILGGIDLSTLLTVVSALTGSDVPKMLSRELPDRVEARFEWQTEITHSDPLNLFLPRADSSKPPTVLAMNGLMTTPLANPADTNFEATANLTNFKVNLFASSSSLRGAVFNAKKGQAGRRGAAPRRTRCIRRTAGVRQRAAQPDPVNGFSDPPSLMDAERSARADQPADGERRRTTVGRAAPASPPSTQPAQVKFNPAIASTCSAHGVVPRRRRVLCDRDLDARRE
jgi:hypothetical protein